MSSLVQNCNTLYLMICPTLGNFLRPCNIMGHNRQTIIALVNFLKKSPFQAKEKFGLNLFKNYLTLYLMIFHRVYFEIFLHDGAQQIDKVCIRQFSPQFSPKNPLLTQLRNLGTIWTKIYNLMSQAIMSHDSISKSLKYGMMGYNRYTKVTVNLPKIFPFWAGVFWAKFGPKLCNIMSHDSLSEDLFEVLWHDEAQYRQTKVVLVIFSKFRNFV